MLSSGLSLLFLLTDATYTIRADRDLGPVKAGVLGVNAPDKYMDWGLDPAVPRRIREAGFTVVRTGLVQDGLYQKRDIYPAEGKYEFKHVDRNLKQIIDGGAEPLIGVIGFPAGIRHRLDGEAKIVEADWDAYARFMAGVVKHYNVDLAVGKKIRYWELWNEPGDEPDGKFRSKEQYAEFVRKVAPAMRAVDPSIQLIGPVAPWSDMSPTGWPAFVAKELGKEIDVICWHDYGGQKDQNDDERMAWPREHYGQNVRRVGSEPHFKSPDGKTFGTAITEYNMSWGDGPPEFLAKYRSEYNAAFLGASLVQAYRSGLDLFCQYLLAQAGKNNLGLLDNQTFVPYRPYYAFPMFSRHIGTRLIEVEGEAPGLEVLATKRDRTLTIHLVNTTPTEKTVTLKGLPSRVGTIWRLSAFSSGSKGQHVENAHSLKLPPRSITALKTPLSPPEKRSRG